MGIPHLTRHLMPFSEAIALGRKSEYHYDGLAYVDSIVIDGPSLVHHVFSRLLCFSNPNLEYAGSEPTCNDVSLGVAIYLLQLMLLGVKIEKILFDGALPLRKRETRLSRLDRGRRKLEVFRHKTKNGFRQPQGVLTDRTINIGHLFSSRPVPAKLQDVPDNPFIVPAVFEDLKIRWNKERVLSLCESFFGTATIETLSDFPWANITAMVQGEADTHCAYVARTTNCAVLTNDSDLILHELGTHGSVILCSSVGMIHWNTLQPTQSQIRAVRLCPATITERLGVASMLSLAYDIKNNPGMGIAQLVQRVRGNQAGWENEVDYQIFLEEYQCDVVEPLQTKTPPQCLDVRLAELFWQYAMPLTYTAWKDPHVYLPMLTEDHSRRCAWVEGRLLRRIGYSVLNAAYPKSQRYSHVSEFVRRGGRIILDQIDLEDTDGIEREVASIQAQLTLIEGMFKQKLVSLTHWRIFALRYIFSESSPSAFPDSKQLTQFLVQGHMDERLKWVDIHLNAQIQSVLYSLRMLHQLLAFSKPSHIGADQLKSTLDDLPPLHVMTTPSYGVMRETEIGVTSLHGPMRLLFQPATEVDDEGRMGNVDQPHDSGGCQTSTLACTRIGSKTQNGAHNPYELLALE